MKTLQQKCDELFQNYKVSNEEPIRDFSSAKFSGNIDKVLTISESLWVVFFVDGSTRSLRSDRGAQRLYEALYGSERRLERTEREVTELIERKAA